MYSDWDKNTVTWLLLFEISSSALKNALVVREMNLNVFRTLRSYLFCYFGTPLRPRHDRYKSFVDRKD